MARLHVSSCLIHCHLAQQQTNKQKKGGACGVTLCVCVCVCAMGEKKKKSKKECGPTISDGLPTDAHSQVRSHYCATRRLLPAVFPPWAGSSLLRQPGPSGLPPRAHIDAGLSVDTRSTWHACWQGPRPQTVPTLGLQVAGLQEHATTPSRQKALFKRI